jgi:hypothetical protein
MKMQDAERDTIFEIVAYLIACSRLTLDEAPRYGSQRLIVGASRLIATLEGSGDADPVLDEWKRQIDENVFKMALAYPEYVEWLGELTRDVGREATERNLAAPAPGA